MTVTYSDDLISSSDIFRIYKADIGAFPRISDEDVVELGKQILAGRKASQELHNNDQISIEQQTYLQGVVSTGKQAQEELLKANYRLVISVARKHLDRGLTLNDLVQEGNLGLMRAVERYDYRIAKFSTYATWWIRQAISRGLSDKGQIMRIPVHVHENLALIRRSLDHLKGVEITPEAIAAETGLSDRQIKSLLPLLDSYMLSLDQPVGEDGDGGASLGDFVDSPYMQPEEAELSDLYTFVAMLPQRQQEVLRYRFGLDDYPTKTLEEIGVLYDVTRERIRQIEEEALTNLRKLYEGRGCKSSTSMRSQRESEKNQPVATADLLVEKTAEPTPVSQPIKATANPFFGFLKKLPLSVPAALFKAKATAG